jgi:drug/metabolite transporter (DMT)-like permease
MTHVGRIEGSLPGAGLKGALYMSAFALMFAIVEALGERMPAGYPAYQVVWGRYFVHLLLTLGIMLILNRSISIRSSRPLVQVCRSAMMLVMPVAFVLAAGAAGSASAWAVLWLAPLMTMAWGSRLQGLRVAPIDWIFAVTCLAGAVLVLRPDPVMPLTGGLWGLLSAASFAAYLVLTVALRGDSVWTSLMYTAVVPFLGLSLVMPAVWRPLSPRAALVVIAIGATGWLALLALDKALRLMEAAHAAVFIFLAVTASALIARDTDHVASVVGAGIIAFALIGATVRAGHRIEVAPGDSTSAPSAQSEKPH